jgi:hypothetical protein
VSSFFISAEKTATMKKGLPYMTLADKRLNGLVGLARAAGERARLPWRVAADLSGAVQTGAAREFWATCRRGAGGLQICCNIASAAVIFDL